MVYPPESGGINSSGVPIFERKTIKNSRRTYRFKLRVIMRLTKWGYKSQVKNFDVSNIKINQTKNNQEHRSWLSINYF